jgi:hypothetical protein
MSKFDKYESITLQCVDCNQPYTLSPAEQYHFADELGFDLPKRCPICRKIKKRRNLEIRDTHNKERQ